MVTVRTPQACASASVGTQTSIRAPMMAPPVSAANPSPYPGIVMRVPSGMTDGSTATTPGPTGIPVAVVPGSAYAVETTVIRRPPTGAAAGGAGEAAAVDTGSVAGAAARS